MTDERLVRSLTTALDDLAAARTPDYLEAAIEHASSRSQRPSWTFPERWLPMDLATTRIPTARFPMRAIGILALIGILIAVSIAVYFGAQTRLPEPFGPAANGLIAFAADGDIHAIDPETGETTPLVSGPEVDSIPLFSPDGTKIAFERQGDGLPQTETSIVVADADGSNPRVIAGDPLVGGPGEVAWSPDSSALLVGAKDGAAIWLLDVSGDTAPRKIATDAEPHIQPFQPPDGAAILIGRSAVSGATLARLDLDSLQEIVLARAVTVDGLGSARWSPDGSRVVYGIQPSDDLSSRRLFVVNADGTDPRQITDEPGTWFDIDASWSPDGERIAFTRYEQVGEDWIVHPITVFSVADQTLVEVGPIPRETRAAAPGPGDATASPGEGFSFEWSPDGNFLIAFPGEADAHPVMIDARDGTWRNLEPIAQPGPAMQSWQREAP